MTSILVRVHRFESVGIIGGEISLPVYVEEQMYAYFQPHTVKYCAMCGRVKLKDVLSRFTRRISPSTGFSSAGCPQNLKKAQFRIQTRRRGNRDTIFAPGRWPTPRMDRPWIPSRKASIRCLAVEWVIVLPSGLTPRIMPSYRNPRKR